MKKKENDAKRGEKIINRGENLQQKKLTDFQILGLWIPQIITGGPNAPVTQGPLTPRSSLHLQAYHGVMLR